MAGYCDTCRGPCQVPTWQLDDIRSGGWYADDPLAARVALRRAHEPKTTAAERAAAHAFNQALAAGASIQEALEHAHHAERAA